jgi:hypothetical protein
MARFLDAYSDAFAAGTDIEDERWRDATPPVTPLSGAGGVYVFARAVPGDATAPVAVHLVDWREQPEPFRLSVRPQAFFGSQPLRFRLFTPVLPHDRNAHDQAFATRNYAGLINETELARGLVNTVALPALNPWGVLVVEPDATAATGVWPPSFLTNDAEFYTDAQVTLDCATPGAHVHYTLDGSTPSAASPRYTGPVTVRSDCTVTAVGILDGVASAAISARFAKRERPPSLIANGEFDAELEGWRRIVWDEAGTADEALMVDIDGSGRLSGPNSVRLHIRKPTGTVYHLRLVHPFDARPGAEYTLAFRAVADGPVRCRVGMQAQNAPHKVLGMRQETIGTKARRYTLAGGGLNSGEATGYLVQFDVGAAENAGRTLWLDDVRLVSTPAP